MHWAEEHVNPMLAIRNILCSGRWQEDWPKIEARLRQHVHQKAHLSIADIILLHPPLGAHAPCKAISETLSP